MRTYDLDFLHRSFVVAKKARQHGNHPFGAILVDGQGNLLLEAENSVVSDMDCTAHAETNLVRMAVKAYGPAILSTCTLYASTEPCPMCAGAIFWSNINRLVYGLGQDGLYQMIANTSEQRLLMPCRDVFYEGSRDIEVLGPLLEEEAIRVHADFWDMN